jgi:hypothetical protein
MPVYWAPGDAVGHDGVAAPGADAMQVASSADGRRTWVRPGEAGA